ncbi:hypothetical protein DFO66_10521 [Brevibacterium sanguinis]|uniref:DUF3311 domain-containing protein n=2 Tax=Brevibacterium TaxID=1696 RepID=A0A366IK97_9MICO|nr:hypothetical protein DFO66_10521 [Brevibacterium sanguinis]RBP71178.1 hypothetical protein DFO65_10621 [Brevibacterium celere]
MNEPTRPKRTVTATQVIIACIPALLIIFTPVFPFANEPGLILGVPTVIVWMAALVVAIVAILQIIDRQITAREDALEAERRDADRTAATAGAHHSEGDRA